MDWMAQEPLSFSCQFGLFCSSIQFGYGSVFRDRGCDGVARRKEGECGGDLDVCHDHDPVGELDEIFCISVHNRRCDLLYGAHLLELA